MEIGQIRYCVIALFDPHKGVWVHFNRIPALIVAFCRRWMAIPVQNFYDDFRIIEPISLDGSAER